MCGYVYVCVYWCTMTSIYSTYIQTNLAYFTLSAHMCVWIYMYINIYVYMYDMCVCGYEYVCVYWCTITSIYNVYIYKNTYKYVDIHIYV